jgi:hypothetical protein
MASFDVFDDDTNGGGADCGVHGDSVVPNSGPL